MDRNPETVKIPKPPREAFNKNRPAGQLLLAQVQHLRHGLARHLEKVVALLVIDVNKIKTEGDVSEYSRKVMTILHQQSVRVGRKKRSLYATTGFSSGSSRDRRSRAGTE